MVPKPRVSVGNLGAGALIVLVLGHGNSWSAAPVLAEDPDAHEAALKLLLSTDAKLEAKLIGAEDLIKEKQWKNACLVLQSILDHPHDAFFPGHRQTADGKKEVLFLSAKNEADRLIGSLPAEGQAVYRRLYTEKAKVLLQQANNDNDVSLLANVALRFLNTDSGEQALTLLATYKLDRGESTIASLYFKRLLDREGAENLPPLSLFKAALAFRYVGDHDEADEVWKRLKLKIKKDGLRLGNGQVLTLEEVDKLLGMAKPSS